MRRRTAIILLALIFIMLALLAVLLHLRYGQRETVTIASWNLQVFGDKKAQDARLMDFYTGKIGEYDIVFVQEIRDADGSSFTALCARLENRSCAVSSRAGRSSSKEQYGLVYRDGIGLLEFEDYNPSLSEDFERPPVRARLAMGGYNLTVYGIHVKPDDAPAEIAALERLVGWESLAEEMVVVLGDLNADCGYYDEGRDDFGGWLWAIGDGADTTVSARKCAYDRILLDAEARGRHARSGVDRSGITEEVSDHYLVWVALR